ncbi:MAG: hypothetical protein PVH56_11805, partial [Desulfobacterales bacterium]
DPNDYAKVQQKVVVRVIDIDLARNRISLSMKSDPGAQTSKPPRQPKFTKKSKRAKRSKKKRDTPFHNPFEEAFGKRKPE